MAYISSAEKIGIEKGVKQGESNFLVRLMTHKFGFIANTYEQRIALADTETLLVWGERILNANTIEDIFQDS